MPKLFRSYAISHLPYSYELKGDFIVPFVLGVDDAKGDNIAERKAWSETRAHYWFWKNLCKDYTCWGDGFVAFNQYRRCFWFPPLIHKGSPFHHHAENINRELGQTIIHMSRQEYIEYIHFVEAVDRTELIEWLYPYDIVVNRPLLYPKSIAEIYGEHHRPADWQIFAKVCRKHGLDEGKHHWLTGHLMFMMRPDLFNDYMTLWWEVMSEVDRLVWHEDHPYQHRKIGYMTERFMSAWLVKIRTERPTLRIQTLPIVEGLFQNDRPAEGVM